MKSSHNTGFGLVEVVIGAAIITLFIGAAISTVAGATRLESDLISKIEAQYLAEEGIEVVRILRDTSWQTNIAPVILNTPYYLNFDGSNWILSSTPNLVDNKFTRKVTFAAGYRNTNSDIASSGTADTDLRLITVTVTWPSRGGTGSVSLATYLTNLFAN